MENGAVMYDQREHFVSSEDLQSIAKCGELALRIQLNNFIHMVDPKDLEFMHRELGNYIRSLK